ncbi:DUF397 domain-containing protein [Streptomyces sp. UNOC14_S4]|uniref:DUF397 domain-containing protein n=1 Tax=Streptomyces sp. UNOC14_S4 TaxID=2872340 RepID=UPI001E3F85CF|nr:DUF397 domain-containing protein [Streptomyces sp. UNOC14_S4]MCC3772251.1 DUF397 domain-containing protein [Streptomyces sp. UNOC14_S4]
MPTGKPDWPIAAWRKSTHSVTDGSCVEVAEHYPRAFSVRDSKDPSRTPIVTPRAVWSDFVATMAVPEGG